MIRSAIRSALVVSSLICAGPIAAETVPGGIDALNDLRAQKGLGRVAVSQKLQAAAEAHGRDMARNNYFDHKSRNGSRVADRAKRQGYRYCSLAENLAKGQTSLPEVMKDWYNSKGHRKNMLKSKVNQVGLARVPSESGDLWVMVLGREGC